MPRRRPKPKAKTAYDSLLPWQQAFVDHYVVHVHSPNATASMRAVRPDYKRPDVIASKLLAKPQVAAAIEERLTRRRQDSELDEKWVLDRLRLVAEHCLQLDGFEANAANRALELIGRHFAMFTDKVAVSDLQHIPDDELDRRIAIAARQAGIPPTSH